MQVLLINPPLNTSLPAAGVYPMGLGYIGAMLRRSDCEIDVLDIRLNKYERTAVSDFLKKNQGKYSLVGIGAMVTAYNYCKWLSGEIRKYNPSSAIIAGGSICTEGELLLNKSDINAVCVGEGEKVVTALANAIRSGEDLSTVSNIMTKSNGKIITTPIEPPMDIDSIPSPAWDLFDMENYTRTPYFVNTGKPSITMITERGCPFECSFCYRNFGRRTRYRNSDKVIEEIKTVVDRFGVGHIDFLDEIFNIDAKYVRELCSKIIREKINITWRCIGRTDLADRETLEIMYEAGCRWIGYGIESGSQEMLDRMQKRQKVENIEKSIKLSRDAGIIVTGTFIIGMPGETEETVNETKDFFRRNRIFNIPFFPVPYPGTLLYDECKEKGLIGDEEEYVTGLEKDVTELIINLTEISDARLIKIKDDMISEFKELIPSMELDEKKKKGVLSHAWDSIAKKFRNR